MDRLDELADQIIEAENELRESERKLEELRKKARQICTCPQKHRIHGNDYSICAICGDYH